MRSISLMIDSIADRLEAQGFLKEAYELDIIANTYEEISKKLDNAYEQHAPQGMIDQLETQLSALVGEEDMEGHVPATSEGYSIEEELRNLYHQYLNAGNKNVTPYDRQELIDIMRGAVEQEMFGQRPMKGLTDTQILEAAKDAYERHKGLSTRRSDPNRMHKTPGEALKGLGQIRGRLGQ